jgi:chromosomal replication initiation ATPase DnaA
MIPELPAPTPLTFDEHIKAVCAAHGVSKADLFEQDKTRHKAEARQELMFRAVIRRGLTLPKAARLLRRDHTTVLHGIRRHAAARFGTEAKASLEAIRQAARWQSIQFAARSTQEQAA